MRSICGTGRRACQGTGRAGQSGEVASIARRSIRSHAAKPERSRSAMHAALGAVSILCASTLGHHEIATVQTTAIDQTAGTVNLTTVLAHASGEWIACGLASLRDRGHGNPAPDGCGTRPMPGAMRSSRSWGIGQERGRSRRAGPSSVDGTNATNREADARQNR